MFRAISFLPHRSLVAVLVACSAVLSLTTATSAPANELDDRRQRIRENLHHAHRELNHSSAALVRAAKLVRSAEERLARAEGELERRREELAVAVVVDNQMQSELELATARLARARAALARGRRNHHHQEQVLRRVAASTYQAGAPGLVGLSMVLTSRDPAELTSQLNSVRNVLDKETATLRRLEASRMLLELQKRRVATAKVDVAQRREDAAETLAQTEELEARAEAASADVERLVEERSRAKRQAAKAKADDKRRLHQLQRERDQIVRLIKKREAALRKKRSRAAIKRAKKASMSRRAPLLDPVDTYITSHYGMRLHPIYRAWRLHDGTDFGARCGHPVRAAANGRVIAKYYNTGYGRRVIIAHGYLRGASVATTYNHLRGYSTFVGQRVNRGEVIGFVGSSGYSTGCHLHFMVFRNWRTVNPMNWL